MAQGGKATIPDRSEDKSNQTKEAYIEKRILPQSVREREKESILKKIQQKEKEGKIQKTY